MTMKLFTRMVLIAAMIAAPVASFAQSNQSVSRAQVREELAQLEKAGYDPHDWIHYPENIQAAEAKLAAQNNALDQYVTLSVGVPPRHQHIRSGFYLSFFLTEAHSEKAQSNRAQARRI